MTDTTTRNIAVTAKELYALVKLVSRERLAKEKDLQKAQKQFVVIDNMFQHLCNEYYAMIGDEIDNESIAQQFLHDQEGQ